MSSIENYRDVTTWDDIWSNLRLPVEVGRSRENPSANDLLDLFERYLPCGRKMTALEIGGAPGGYAAYFHKRFGYRMTLLDYSRVGVEKTRENFELLGVDANIVQGDLFSPELELGLFDVVYSLGFIEHFDDMGAVVNRHLRFLKPGGVLLLGVPNFLGVNRIIMKRLSPARLREHNLSTMDIKTWRSMEVALGLKPIFRGYVGGFAPLAVNFDEVQSLDRSVLRLLLRCLQAFYRSVPKVLNPGRRITSKMTSFYLVGIYTK